MTSDIHLIHGLLAQGRESELVEFKHNNTDPNEIGEQISALANSAALLNTDMGFIVWGINNETLSIEGTHFNPFAHKIGNQSLEMWLNVAIRPRHDFSFHELDIDSCRLVLLKVRKSVTIPVRFKDFEYIRVGSHTVKLRDYPEKARRLWQVVSQHNFELSVAADRKTSDEVLACIDYPSYFQLTKQNLPNTKAGILERLEQERFIVQTGGDYFDITNLGAVLFCRELPSFASIARKSVRVITYKGKNKIEAHKEQVGVRGYASGFERLIDYILAQLPSDEHISHALRNEKRMYPTLAIRELVANSLIHQDFSISGTGPVIELFSDRMEITSPGTPLIEPQRFIDAPPRSRNEHIAGQMRRLGICEERGSGIDKVVFEVEKNMLPAPEFTVIGDHTKSILFAGKKLSSLSRDDKLRACYQHACVCYISSDQMTNASLRKRFGVADENYSTVSRIIADAIESGLIKSSDPRNTSKKHMKYVPFWA